MMPDVNSFDGLAEKAQYLYQIDVHHVSCQLKPHVHADRQLAASGHVSAVAAAVVRPKHVEPDCDTTTLSMRASIKT